MAVDLCAYCDESGTEGRDFVVAGWVGPAAEWEKLDAPWKCSLKDAGLLEFKAGDRLRHAEHVPAIHCALAVSFVAQCQCVPEPRFLVHPFFSCGP